MTSISFENVNLSYGDLSTLRDLTFDIASGESVALTGPSGCGKSTTLHLVAGLLAPTAGRVLVDGAPVEAPRRATAFIQQDLGLFSWKTVLQNAALGLIVRKAPKAEANARAADALARVGLAGFERAYPKELSGGMRQRLALARALAMDADLLLMDEPLSAIDALLRESLQDALLELWRERAHTQMFVTHSIEEAAYLGKRILVFSPRPATLVAEIDNPSLGDRTTAAFLETCQRIREALALAAEGTAPDAPGNEPAAALTVESATHDDPAAISGFAASSASGGKSDAPDAFSSESAAELVAPAEAAPASTEVTPR